jgi:hypothetical protein
VESAPSTPAGAASVEESTEVAGDEASEPQRVRLSDRGELDRIIELYMAGSYEACSTQLGGFLDAEGGDAFQESEVIEQGRLYFASCALLEGHRAEARQALRAALEENPLMQSPDSLTFPPPVVSLFLEVRDEVQQLIADSEKEQVVRLRRENALARQQAEQREHRERELEKLAREQFVVAKNSRAVASIPLGFGQYQNGKNALGALFLVSEGLLLGTAVTSGLILRDLKNKAEDADGELTDVAKYNRQTQTAYDTLTYASWGFIGVAALGIVEAHLNFQRERRLEKRTRDLPKELQLAPESQQPETNSSVQLTPVFGVGPSGGHLGVTGTF